MGDHWKSLANKLGAPGMDAPTSEPTPTPEPAKPARPAAPAPAHVDPPPAARAPEPEPIPEPPVETGRKGKRKSSWDTLTSFFGISSSEPSAPEVSSAAPAETDALDAGFAKPVAREPERPSRAKPPAAKSNALDELFGDAPRQELSWDKPAQRMVDDVSDWDDEPVVPEPTLDDQADTFTPAREASEDAEREPGRRRRRRRGRGRRDESRGEQVDGDRPARTGSRDGHRAPGPRSDAPTADLSSDRDDDIEPWEAELDVVEPVDDWVEPSSFGSVSDVDIDADVDPDAPLPQRRSNRRRRRGRGRGDRAEGSLPPATDPVGEVREVREPRPAREPREPREPRGEGREPRGDGREPREVRERPARQPRESRAVESDMELEARPERTRREPREPREGKPVREGRSRPPREARREPVAPVDDLDNQVDSSLAAELEGDDGAGNRHPKIPTWADSLEAIINANMENHSRGDHRGGSRGRSRGNGGPPPRRP